MLIFKCDRCGKTFPMKIIRGEVNTVLQSVRDMDFKATLCNECTKDFCKWLSEYETEDNNGTA